LQKIAPPPKKNSSRNKSKNYLQTSKGHPNNANLNFFGQIFK
jgi:hypothetical protein